MRVLLNMARLWLVAVAAIAWGPATALLHADWTSGEIVEASGDPDRVAADKAPLPPRALLRVGTDDLRTRYSISGIAFSPDRRLIAAAESNNPVPRYRQAASKDPESPRARLLPCPGSRRQDTCDLEYSLCRGLRRQHDSPV